MRKPIATVGISESGVNFEAIDGELVHIIFLVVSPVDRPGDHLRALDCVSRHLHNEMFRRFLRKATTRDEILELLEDADRQAFGN